MSSYATRAKRSHPRTAPSSRERGCRAVPQHAFIAVAVGEAQGDHARDLEVPQFLVREEARGRHPHRGRKLRVLETGEIDDGFDGARTEESANAFMLGEHLGVFRISGKVDAHQGQRGQLTSYRLDELALGAAGLLLEQKRRHAVDPGVRLLERGQGQRTAPRDSR